MEQKAPTLQRLPDDRYELRYGVIDDTGEILSTTLLRGSLEEIIGKTVAAHRNAVLMISRTEKKLLLARVDLARFEFKQ